MRFCCGVTLYYPSEKDLEQIVRFRNDFEKIYVFDNTDSDKKLSNQEYLKKYDSVSYLSKDSNEGLSVAFNLMCQMANKDCFDYICLLDQDSDFSSENILKMINHITNENSILVGIYAPKIIYRHLENNNSRQETSRSQTEIKWSISSGSFINLYLYMKTKGFDENYFIDRLDYDYCIQLNKFGYKIIRINNAFLLQNLGQLREGLFWTVSQHSPIRNYYIFRNRIFFNDKNEIKSVLNSLMVFFQSLKHILRVILAEDEKKEKIEMMAKGYCDYRNKKMGKYNLIVVHQNDVHKR